MGRLLSSAEIDAIIARAHIARETLGAEGDFALDFHGRFSLAAARSVLPELVPLRPMFVEEPVLPEHTHLIGELTNSPIPIATGERLYSRADFLPALQAGIAVAQPDLSHAGGISEVRRIAALAEVFDVVTAPHCPLGPLSLAASLQIAFSTPNFLIQEQSIGIHYHDGADLTDYILDTTTFQPRNGYLSRPSKPGLGIDIDEAAVRAADSKFEQWRTPIWRHADGSFAEW